MTLLPDSGEPRNLLAGTVLDTAKPQVLCDPTWQHICQRYCEVKELDEGGQALVFQGKERQKPHRKVALKVYRGNSDAERHLFEREVAMVGSPHLPRDLVVGLYGIVREVDIQRDLNISGGDIQPYLVLERINGCEPLKYVQSLSILRRIELLATQTRALQRLHDCNLVVRDVSARNIMIEPGDRVRFFDFAAAAPDKKVCEGESVSVPVATPDTVPIEVLQGQIKASKQTDLFAAVGIGFLMLTGKQKGEVLRAAGIEDENHVRARQLWDAELRRCHVPSPIRQIVLKGLRKADPTLDPDRNVYAKVEHIADDIDAWKKSVERRRQFLLVAALMLLVAIPGLWCCWQWRQATQASNLVASRRLVSDLQQQVGQLATREHPAVKRLLNEAVSTSRQLDDAQARGESHGVSLKLADEMQSVLHRALDIGRGIERGNQLREAIGKVLLEDEAGKRAGFWVTAAPMIGQRLDEMRRRYVALAGQIQAGQIESLSESLALLQTDLSELFRVNIEARSVLEAREGYQRQKQQVPPRLLPDDGFLVIDSGADEAEKSWATPEWNGGKSLSLARYQFGMALQQLAEWLPKHLTPAELAALQEVNQANFAAMAREKERLREDNERLKADHDRFKADVANSESLLAEMNAAIFWFDHELSRLDEHLKRARESQEKLIVENERLREQFEQKDEELARAKEELTRYKIIADILRAENQTLRADNQALLAENQALKRELEKLKDELKKPRRFQFIRTLSSSGTIRLDWQATGLQLPDGAYPCRMTVCDSKGVPLKTRFKPVNNFFNGDDYVGPLQTVAVGNQAPVRVKGGFSEKQFHDAQLAGQFFDLQGRADDLQVIVEILAPKSDFRDPMAKVLESSMPFTFVSAAEVQAAFNLPVQPLKNGVQRRK